MYYDSYGKGEQSEPRIRKGYKGESEWYAYLAVTGQLHVQMDPLTLAIDSLTTDPGEEIVKKSENYFYGDGSDMDKAGPDTGVKETHYRPRDEEVNVEDLSEEIRGLAKRYQQTVYRSFGNCKVDRTEANVKYDGGVTKKGNVYIEVKALLSGKKGGEPKSVLYPNVISYIPYGTKGAYFVRSNKDDIELIRDRLNIGVVYPQFGKPGYPIPWTEMKKLGHDITFIRKEYVVEDGEQRVVYKRLNPGEMKYKTVGSCSEAEYKEKLKEWWTKNLQGSIPDEKENARLEYICDNSQSEPEPYNPPAIPW